MEKIAKTLYEVLHHGVTNIVVVGGVALVMAYSLVTMVKAYRAGEMV